MSGDLWISIALSVPLAVAANLLSRPVQAFWDKWLEGGGERRASRLRKRIAAAQRVKARPNESTARLIRHGISCVVELVFVSLAIAVLLAQPNISVEGWVPWKEQASTSEKIRIGAMTFMFFVAMISFLGSTRAFRSVARAMVDADGIDKVESQLAKLVRPVK